MSEVDVYENFEDMGLKEDLLRGIFSYGYEKPPFNSAKGNCSFYN